jgi:hypothetical protein
MAMEKSPFFSCCSHFDAHLYIIWDFPWLCLTIEGYGYQVKSCHGCRPAKPHVSLGLNSLVAEATKEAKETNEG